MARSLDAGVSRSVPTALSYFPSTRETLSPAMHDLRLCGDWKRVKAVYKRSGGGGALSKDELHSFVIQLQDFFHSALSEDDMPGIQSFRHQLLHDLEAHTAALDAEQLESYCCIAAVSGLPFTERQSFVVQRRLYALIDLHCFTSALNVTHAVGSLGHRPQPTLLQKLLDVAVAHCFDVTPRQWSGLLGLTQRHHHVVLPRWLDDLLAATGRQPIGMGYGVLCSIMGVIVCMVEQGTLQSCDRKLLRLLDAFERHVDEGVSVLSITQVLTFTSLLVATTSQRHVAKWVERCKDALGAMPLTPKYLDADETQQAMYILVTTSGWREIDLLTSLLKVAAGHVSRRPPRAGGRVSRTAAVLPLAMPASPLSSLSSSSSSTLSSTSFSSLASASSLSLSAVPSSFHKASSSPTSRGRPTTLALLENMVQLALVASGKARPAVKTSSSSAGSSNAGSSSGSSGSSSGAGTSSGSSSYSTDGDDGAPSGVVLGMAGVNGTSAGGAVGMSRLPIHASSSGSSSISGPSTSLSAGNSGPNSSGSSSSSGNGGRSTSSPSSEDGSSSSGATAAVPRISSSLPEKLRSQLHEVLEGSVVELSELEGAALPRLLRVLRLLDLKPSSVWEQAFFARVSDKAYQLDGRQLLALLLASHQLHLRPPARALAAVYQHHERMLDVMLPADYAVVLRVWIGVRFLPDMPLLEEFFCAALFALGAHPESYASPMTAAMTRRLRSVPPAALVSEDDETPQLMDLASSARERQQQRRRAAGGAVVSRLQHVAGAFKSELHRQGQWDLMTATNAFCNALVVLAHEMRSGPATPV